MSPYDGMKLASALRLLLRTGRGRRRGRHRRGGDAVGQGRDLRAVLTRQTWGLGPRLRWALGRRRDH
jgi:hypothetical protein